MSDSITYTEAYNELKEIVASIEEGEISVDDLSEKVKRAAFLIALCRKKLTTTEEDVNKILKTLESETD